MIDQLVTVPSCSVMTTLLFMCVCQLQYGKSEYMQQKNTFKIESSHVTRGLEHLQYTKTDWQRSCHQGALNAKVVWTS